MGFDSHFVHSCAISRRVTEVDAGGADVLVWQARQSQVPCRYVAMSGTWKRGAGVTTEAEATVDYRLFLDECDLAVGDRVSDLRLEDGTQVGLDFVVAGITPRRTRHVAHQSVQLGEFAASTLTDSCFILRQAEAVGAAGGQVQVFTEDTTPVPCLLLAQGETGRSGAREQIIADRLHAVTLYTVYTELAVQIKASDRVKLGPRTFEVLGVVFASGDIIKRLVCTEVL